MRINEKIVITEEQLAAGFDRGVSALDEVRAQQLAEGLRLESAKGALHGREHERLRRKYGEKHPRTLEAASRAAASAEYKLDLPSSTAMPRRRHPMPARVGPLTDSCAQPRAIRWRAFRWPPATARGGGSRNSGMPARMTRVISG